MTEFNKSKWANAEFGQEYIDNADICIIERRRSHSNAFIGLISAKGASKFYEQYGFAERPVDGPGMYKIWKK